MNYYMNYKEWNTALWNYFFPQGDENPILYLDENMINDIGTRANIETAGSYEDDFLSKTLINADCIKDFVKDWKLCDPYHLCSGLKWDKLVESLMCVSLDGKPAYFAMLCAIMYLACTTEANHSVIKAKALHYLGDSYKGRVGQLIDELMTKLHDDISSFDSDRMICGKQVNISRIKYHMVLKSDVREDFIDFIEINNLKWDYELYADFINNRFIPALNNAHKRDFIDLVIKSEFIPYVKNILLSDLKFGKTSTLTGNEVQPIDVKWKYELYFDIDGTPLFYISTDAYLPFAVELSDGQFIQVTEGIIADYIAANVDFGKYPATNFSHQGRTYNLSNVAEQTWDDDIYFENVANNAYQQVAELLPGRDYLRLVRNNMRNLTAHVRGWSPSNKPIRVEGYNIYEISNYQPVGRTNNNNRIRVKDTFELNGVGTWFSINLTEDQEIYWQADNLGNNTKQLIPQIKGRDGKMYFQLPRTGANYLSGKLYVSHDNFKSFDDFDTVVDTFEWDGNQEKYFFDGWGEVSTVRPTYNIPNATTIRRIVSGNSVPTDMADMIIQILYDVADADGCINQKKIVAALDFVMKFHGIIPTRKNRLSLIYALRRLGYIVAFYNNDTNEFENQLCASYLEVTNYSLSNMRSAYLVKGVYEKGQLETLKNTTRPSRLGVGNEMFYYVQYKRPYDKQSESYYPEYCCLPDMVLIETMNTMNWTVQNHPTADELIGLMKNMGDFERDFNIANGGDIFVTPSHYNTPCIINDVNGLEVLCTSSTNGYKLHKVHLNASGYNVPIDKHLSRAYCQNSRNLPVCFMENDLLGNVNTAKVYFASGMAIPELLDIALCDLNLGLPRVSHMFVVNNIDNKTSWLGKEYATGAAAANIDVIKQALEKLSNRNITSFSASDAIRVCKNGRHIKHSMKYLRDANCNSSLILSLSGTTIAFSQGRDKVYSFDIRTNRFREVIGNSLNEKMSNVIENKHFNYGPVFNGTVPNFNDPMAINVKIIK